MAKIDQTNKPSGHAGDMCVVWPDSSIISQYFTIFTNCQNICQSRFKFLPFTKSPLKRLPNSFQKVASFKIAKVAKFGHTAASIS